MQTGLGTGIGCNIDVPFVQKGLVPIGPDSLNLVDPVTLVSGPNRVLLVDNTQDYSLHPELIFDVEYAVVFPARLLGTTPGAQAADQVYNELNAAGTSGEVTWADAQRYLGILRNGGYPGPNIGTVSHGSFLSLYESADTNLLQAVVQ